MYTYILFLLNLPPMPHPTPLFMSLEILYFTNIRWIKSKQNDCTDDTFKITTLHINEFTFQIFPEPKWLIIQTIYWVLINEYSLEKDII